MLSSAMQGEGGGEKPKSCQAVTAFSTLWSAVRRAGGSFFSLILSERKANSYHFTNAGTPEWWFEFCGSIDVILGVYLIYFAMKIPNRALSSKESK